MSRQATEADFRKEEFRHAKAEDYEVRMDGKVVRKDRWITGMERIAGIIGEAQSVLLEIDDVVKKVEVLAARDADKKAAMLFFIMDLSLTIPIPYTEIVHRKLEHHLSCLGIRLNHLEKVKDEYVVPDNIACRFESIILGKKPPMQIQE